MYVCPSDCFLSVLKQRMTYDRWCESIRRLAMSDSTHNSLFIIISVIVLLYVNQGFGKCFYGGTTSCQFTCHCDNDDQCTREGDESGKCTNGCGVNSEWAWQGDVCQIGNVALGNTARLHRPLQSGRDAGLAVDGDISPSTYSHAVRDGVRLYWYVDLSSVHAINVVMIYTVNSALRSTVSGVDVFVSENINPTDSDLCGTQTGSIQSVITITCRVAMLGRYVRIKQQHNIITEMAFSEVAVIGYEYVECGEHDDDYRYGPGCLHHCNCQSQCHQITGRCQTCRPGWTKVDVLIRFI